MKKVVILLFILGGFLLISPSIIYACHDSSECTIPPNTYCEPGTWVCTTPPGGGGGGGGGGGSSGSTVDTALGPIPTDPQELVKWVLKFAILMGGGIAFLLSVFGGVSIILAGGNPEKINAAKEIIGSALTGLLFIIFSVFLLRFIGYDILQLPGFSNP